MNRWKADRIIMPTLYGGYNLEPALKSFVSDQIFCGKFNDFLWGSEQLREMDKNLLTSNRMLRSFSNCEVNRELDWSF